MNEKHTVFGRVISGYDFVKKIEDGSVNESKPIRQVTVADCGELLGDEKLSAAEAATKGQTKVLKFDDMLEMPDEELEAFSSSPDLNMYGKYALANWVKQAVRKGKEAAISEYKTYWSIRFDKDLELESVIESLNDVIKTNVSARACNTLGELYHASAGGQPNKDSPEWKELATFSAK